MKNHAVCSRGCFYTIGKSSLYIIQEILVSWKMDLEFKLYEAARVSSAEFLFLSLFSNECLLYSLGIIKKRISKLYMQSNPFIESHASRWFKNFSGTAESTVKFMRALSRSILVRLVSTHLRIAGPKVTRNTCVCSEDV